MHVYFLNHRDTGRQFRRPEPLPCLEHRMSFTLASLLSFAAKERWDEGVVIADSLNSRIGLRPDREIFTLR